MFGSIFNQKKDNNSQPSQVNGQNQAQDQNQQQTYGQQPDNQYNNTSNGTGMDNSGQQNNQQYQQNYNQPQSGNGYGYDTGQNQPSQGSGQGINGQNAGQQNNPQNNAQPNQPIQAQSGNNQLPQQQNTTAQPNNPAMRADVSALSHLDPRATLVLTHAQEETRRISQQYIEPDQILFGLLYDEQINKLLEEFSVDSGRMSKEIQAKEKMGTFKGQPTLSKNAQQVFDQAFRDAKMRGSNFVSPEDLLVVLFSPNLTTAAYMQAQGLKKETVVEKLSKSSVYNYGRKTTLEKYSIDLTEEAREGKLDPVAGRDKEIDRIIHILLRRTKNNPIIIGETGVGKTAIVEGLAQKIVNNAVPKDLSDKRVLQLDMAALVAGASHRGEFEERFKNVINEVLGSSGHIVLFIDEIHALMGTGEEGMNSANIIKPYLARGQLQLIGATTTLEYRKNFEKDKAFERRFQPVTAEEPSEENAFEMLKVLRPKYEKFHRVTIPDDTLKECVKLSKKYIGERYLPDKAVDLLDEAASEVKLQGDAGKRGDNQVKKADIEKVVSGWTGIPITKLTEDESEKLLKLEDRIHKRLVDQEEAVVAVSEAVRRGRIGLAAANRPIASFVFLGPTGVGKTELAKTLAELLFGRDDAMARLDMSEYMEKHEVAKLIGAPPGYVGYEEGGQLTEAVRKKPYSIVLLDEIEKAHPDVFNILLQLLEDGRLTDNKGNTISFKNTIVICTSNIGSALIQQQLSIADPKVKKTPEQLNKQFAELQKTVKEELIKFFRPELLNRFDEVVIFKPLRPEHMAGIARLGIAKTAALLKEQGFNLQITDKAIAKLAKDGYDPVYGARPLRRLIQTAIENPIALAIISKKFVPGDTIIIDYNDNTNEFIFNKGNTTVAKTALSDEQFKIILQKIANPDAIASENDKQTFVSLHEKIVKASVGGDAVATSILSITAATPNTEITVLRQKLTDLKGQGVDWAKEILDLADAIAVQIETQNREKKILLGIVNPQTVLSNKETYSKLHDKLTVESQNNNQLAQRILAISDTTPPETIEKLLDDLKEAKDREDELATEVLSVINSMIAQEAEKQQENAPNAKFKKKLKQITNPLYMAAPEDKRKFSELYDKISAADKQDNQIARSILTITDITSDSDIDQLQQQLQQAKEAGDPLAAEILDTIALAIKHEEMMRIRNVLMAIANPLTVKVPDEREKYKEIHDKLSQASQKGDELATALLSVSDKITDDELNQLKVQLDTWKDKQDELAIMVLDAIESYQPPPAEQQGSEFEKKPQDQETAVAQQGQPGTPGAGVQPSQNAMNMGGTAMPQQNTPDQNYPFGMGQQANPNQQSMVPPQPNTPGFNFGSLQPAPVSQGFQQQPVNMTSQPMNQVGFAPQQNYQPSTNQGMNPGINQPMNQQINQGPVFQPPFQNQGQPVQDPNNPMPPPFGSNGSEMQPKR